jgi:putative ATP-dependent endonuclease of the OLD family
LADTLKAEVGEPGWDQTYTEATKGLGNPEGSFGKNLVHIANHLEILHAKDKVPQSLDKLCAEIMRFAASN